MKRRTDPNNKSYTKGKKGQDLSETTSTQPVFYEAKPF